jgi:hypothetical protein
MAKEGCDTTVATSDAVVFRYAVPPTNKMDIDLIYATYLPGISNYQERDNLKALLTRVKTDFQTSLDKGFPYKLNDGYIGKSSLFVYPLTATTCSGDINYIMPVVGQSCSISIYWATGNLWVLVDFISGLAKENLADKANAAAKAELVPLLNSVIGSFKQLDYISSQINDFDNQVNAAQKDQFTITQDYLINMQQVNSSLASVQNIFASALAVANKYSSGEYSQEVLDYAGNIRGYSSKYPVAGMQARLTSLVNQASSLVTAGSGESTKTLKDANLILNDWKSLFEKEVQAIKSYISDLDSKKLILSTKEAYDSEKNRQVAGLEKLTLTRNEYQNRAALAIKMSNSTSNSTDRSTWVKAASAYTSVVQLMEQLISYYPMWLKSIEISYGKNSDIVVEDNGVEEDPAGSVTVVKESGGKFLIRVNTNQESSAVVVRASKSGQKTIIFKVATNTVGAASIRTSRKLSGWRITLLFEDEVLAKATA